MGSDASRWKGKMCQLQGLDVWETLSLGISCAVKIVWKLGQAEISKDHDVYRFQCHLFTNSSSGQTIQIMVGLLNIGLGVILMASNTSSWMMDDTKYSVWLGVLVSSTDLFLIKVISLTLLLNEMKSESLCVTLSWKDLFLFRSLCFLALCVFCQRTSRVHVW